MTLIAESCIMKNMIKRQFTGGIVIMIKGIVCDKNNKALSDVTVELKNEKFETAVSGKTDVNGRFVIETDKDTYPYLIAVKKYKTEYLEYWCRNIRSDEEIELNIRIDKLEVYGMNAFVIGGAYDSIMVYFRPMSLVKFLNNEENICPDIVDIRVLIDEECAEVIEKNVVKESFSDIKMDAYLIQIKKSGGRASSLWKSIEIEVEDESGNIGMAKIYQ